MKISKKNDNLYLFDLFKPLADTSATFTWSEKGLRMAPRAVGVEFDFFEFFGEKMAEPTSGLTPYFVVKESKNVGRAQLRWEIFVPGWSVENRDSEKNRKLFFCIFGSLREYCVVIGQNKSLVQKVGRKKLSKNSSLISSAYLYRTGALWHHSYWLSLRQSSGKANVF